MSLVLRADRPLVFAGGGSHRHLHVQYTAPAVSGTRPRPRVCLAFALDRSGSMGGGKLELAKAALLAALRRLQPTDIFSITTFDDVVEVAMAACPATPGNVQRAARELQHLEPRGSTNLFRGMLVACGTVAQGLGSNDFARCQLLTDGQANQEETRPDELCRHGRELRARGIGLSTYGVGTDVDEDLLRAMADAGAGNYFYVATAADIEGHLLNELRDVTEMSQFDVALHLALPPGVEARWVGPVLHPFARGELTIPVGHLASREVNDTVVQLRFAHGIPGASTTVQVLVSERSSPRCAEAAIDFTFAEAAVNDAQPRSAEVDALAATRHADLARLVAVRLNRQGDYHGAQRALARVVHHLQRYPATNAAVAALRVALEAESQALRHDIGEHARKAQQFASSSALRSKTALGTGRRWEP